MGLAASQARFLAITARKADCEFRSMQIAQNKLSVTRELQAATETYQNALNAEMLVWDYNGMGSDLQAVSYGILMTPSIYNNYSPYLLTDRGGRVVVSSAIAKAAYVAGIKPETGGERSEANFILFMEALSDNHVISTQTEKQLNETMKIVNNPSGQYNGLDGNKYTASETCPYAVPVYVDGSGNFLGKALVNNPDDSYCYDDIGLINYYMGTPADLPKDANPVPENSQKVAYAIYTGLNSEINSPDDVIKLLSSTDPKDKAEKDKIKFVEYTNYDINNGYGSAPMSKNALTGITISQLATAIERGSITNAYNNVQLENILVGAFSSDFVTVNPKNEAQKINYKVKKYSTIYDDQSIIDNIKLSDVLTGNIVLLANHSDNDHKYHDDFKAFINNYLDAVVTQLGLALGVYKGGSTVENKIIADEDYAKIFNFALQFTKEAFINETQIETRYMGDADTQKLAIQEAQKTNSTVFYKNEGGKQNSSAAVSLSNMLSYFLTYVTILEDGFNSGYAANDKVADSAFVTNDPGYRFVVNAAATETNESVLKTDFYMQLFNNLCINGYIVDQDIQRDNEYLEQKLKNGTYFISSLSQDGYFYQSRYNDAVNTLIKVVDDEDAIAVAEAEYNYAKIRLTAKEDKLDLEMKNIDMEISALTTEYDSVKNLISKGIEKTFKQFEG